jgi:hypothetical protein
VARLVDELIDGTDDSDLLLRDVVGGTIICLRARLVWEGLNFPTYFVVGTRWRREGWDGIETEGVFYAVRGLIGADVLCLMGRIMWCIRIDE